jgi:hypothetical protein
VTKLSARLQMPIQLIFIQNESASSRRLRFTTIFIAENATLARSNNHFDCQYEIAGYLRPLSHLKNNMLGNHTNEAFARVEIDALLMVQGWKVQDTNTFRFEVVMAQQDVALNKAKATFKALLAHCFTPEALA